MWQVLLAAAVAGSTGLVAKHIFRKDSGQMHIQNCDDNIQVREDSVESSMPVVFPIASTFDTPRLPNSSGESECDGIFRFSSSGNQSGTCSGFGSKNLRKKARIRCRGLDKGARDEKVREAFKGDDFDPKSRRNGRRFALRLKRRKTNKNQSYSKGRSCSSKDSSLFGWGLGVGIMYMISAGNSEINKLNTTMNETAKVVQELKSELYKRKSACNMQAGKGNTTPGNIRRKLIQPEREKLRAENIAPNEIKLSSLSIVDDGECGSSILTEHPDLEMHDMDQLEAELECELKKLPWCSSETSRQDRVILNLCEDEISGDGFDGPEAQSSHAQQLHGVKPGELDKKLCHLLIERQENQIVELESELDFAQSKLQQKEAELQALKDCVRRLTAFSISTESDGETEADIEECTRDRNSSNEMGCEPKKSAVGMKRPMHSDSCSVR